ncbi:hypothetical protein ISCGN_002726 [Ixodes scapularis]
MLPPCEGRGAGGRSQSRSRLRSGSRPRSASKEPPPPPPQPRQNHHQQQLGPGPQPDQQQQSAPGTDGITNKTLRNLNDESIEAITRYMNKCWERGEIPQQWKTAQVVMNNKPGKKLQIEKLWPIFLTSCVGKLLEHVVLTRLDNHMEDRGLYPHTMIGFRPHLSTQAVMLQIKHQILDVLGRAAGLKAILGLDLTKAFDNVTHKAVLEYLRDLGVGRKAYAYVQYFLSNRTAKLTIGDKKSEEVELGSRGTPQGSVLFHFLFNVAMIGLPKILDKIKGLNHSLYADDLTLWVTSGSDSEALIEETLKRAAEAVDRYAMERRLSCSP